MITAAAHEPALLYQQLIRPSFSFCVATEEPGRKKALFKLQNSNAVDRSRSCCVLFLTGRCWRASFFYKSKRKMKEFEKWRKTCLLSFPFSGFYSNLWKNTDAFGLTWTIKSSQSSILVIYSCSAAIDGTPWHEERTALCDGMTELYAWLAQSWIGAVGVEGNLSRTHPVFVSFLQRRNVQVRVLQTDGFLSKFNQTKTCEVAMPFPDFWLNKWNMCAIFSEPEVTGSIPDDQWLLTTSAHARRQSLQHGST